MSKPSDNMNYLLAGIAVIGSFIGITGFFNSPVKEVQADLETVKTEVSNYERDTSGRLGGIEANVKTLTDGQRDTQKDIKELLQIVKKK